MSAREAWADVGPRDASPSLLSSFVMDNRVNSLTGAVSGAVGTAFGALSRLFAFAVIGVLVIAYVGIGVGFGILGDNWISHHATATRYLRWALAAAGVVYALWTVGKIVDRLRADVDRIDSAEQQHRQAIESLAIELREARLRILDLEGKRP